MKLIHNFLPPQKYTMAGTSQFVPSLNAITTNQDLQWLVQPSLMHPPGPSRSPVPPYPTVVGARPLGPTHSHSHFLRPGVIRASATTAAASTRRRNDEHVRTMVPIISQLIWKDNIFSVFIFKRAQAYKRAPQGSMFPLRVTSDFKVWAIAQWWLLVQYATSCSGLWHTSVTFDLQTIYFREGLTKAFVIYSMSYIIRGQFMDYLKWGGEN